MEMCLIVVLTFMNCNFSLFRCLVLLLLVVPTHAQAQLLSELSRFATAWVLSDPVPQVVSISALPETDPFAIILSQLAEHVHHPLARPFVRLSLQIPLRDNEDWTLLHYVTLRNDKDGLKLLLQEGGDLHWINDEGATPLHLACYFGNEHIVRLLLQNGAPLDGTDCTGDTPFLNACLANSVEVAAVLLAQGASLADKDATGLTALHLAAQHEDGALCKMLLQKGLSPQVTDRDLSTALHVAIASGSVVCTQLLIQAGANVNAQDDEGTAPLHHAACQEDPQFVQLLLRAGAIADIRDETENTPLHLAALFHHAEVLATLLDAGADVEAKDADGHTALMLSTFHGILQEFGTLELSDLSELLQDKDTIQRFQHIPHFPLDVVDYLLQKGASPNCRDKMGLAPAHLAALSGHFPLWKTLVQAGASPNPCFCLLKIAITPARFAVFFRHSEFFRQMILHRPEMLAGSGGMLLFSDLLKTDQDDLAMELLWQLPDLHYRNNMGSSLLHLAAFWENTQAARFLVGRGLPIDDMNTNGLSPLQIAVAANQLTLTEYFLQQGADPDLGMNEKTIPLFRAIKANQVKMVQLLLDYGADVEIVAPHPAGTPGRPDMGSGMSSAAPDAAESNQAPAIGELITIDFHDTSIREILLTVAELHDLLVIVPEGLERKISINLKNVTWPQVFAAILQPRGFSFVQSGSLVTVVPAALPVSAQPDKMKTGSLANESNPVEVSPTSFSLLRQDVDKRQKESLLPFGNTPLLAAIREGNHAIVSLLLEYGATTEANQPILGSSPLEVAVIQKKPDMVQLLLEHGADLHQSDPAGESLFRKVVYQDNPEMLRLFLQHGADPCLWKEWEAANLSPLPPANLSLMKEACALVNGTTAVDLP